MCVVYYRRSWHCDIVTPTRQSASNPHSTEQPYISAASSATTAVSSQVLPHTPIDQTAAVPPHLLHNSRTPSPHSTPHHTYLHYSRMVATQMFLGAAATLIASSTAFMAPMAVRSVAPASSSSLTMQSEGSAYVATLPGAPFSDGKVSILATVSSAQASFQPWCWRPSIASHGQSCHIVCSLDKSNLVSCCIYSVLEPDTDTGTRACPRCACRASGM